MFGTRRVLYIDENADLSILDVECDAINQSVFKFNVLDILSTDFQHVTVDTIWTKRLNGQCALLEMVQKHPDKDRACVLASLSTDTPMDFLDNTTYHDVDEFLELSVVLKAVELIQETKELTERISRISAEMQELPARNCTINHSKVWPTEPFCL